MLDTVLTGHPTAGQRHRAIAAVKRHAHDSRDAADLLAMLGLDHDPAAPPAPRHPHGRLTAAELFDLFAPLAAGRAETR